MKEQGNQFDWSQIVIDLSELPCFKPEAEWPVPSFPAEPNLTEFLSEGYVVVSYSVGRIGYSIIAKQTGDNPSVSQGSSGLIFTDCEPITAEPISPLSAVPAVIINVTSRAATRFSYVPVFGIGENSVCGPVPFDEKTWYVGYSYPLGS